MGNHVTIHDMDFEVTAKDHLLRIIPHAEQVNVIKTLPITHVDIKETGDKTNIVVTSKMRKLDAGGPMLIVLFCTFMFLASMALLYVGEESSIAYTLLSISLLIFTIFWVRMELGYFDYVRKIRAHIKSRLELSSL
ncbi:MAG: hypothetical protein ACHQD8_04755 [Chitinophagales bacterium]